MGRIPAGSTRAAVPSKIATPVSEEISIIEEGEAPRGSELIGTVVAGRYRIERMLGSGGMGSVYRAEHVLMRKAVAVKVLHREMTALPEIVARFEREAVAAGRIEHPNVVAASDFGRLEDGSFYLVLEYVEGKPLAKVIDSEGALAPERALHIVRQIADALGAAHALRIVHRDLKPDNVMLVDRENYPDFVKVLDFGIAKVRMQDETGKTQQLTQLGTVFGTPDYMSPEQARGNPVDGRADLYALGVMLYEMLVGVTPFKSDDLIVVLTRTITEPPPPLPDTVPPPVRDLVMRLLKKQPDERFQTARELIEQIDALIGPAAPPPSSMVLSARAPSAPDLTTKEAVPASLASPAAPPSSAAVAISAKAPSSEPLELAVPTERSPRQRPAWLSRPVMIGRRQVPAWTLLTAGLGLVILGAVTTASLSGGADSPESAASANGSATPPPADKNSRERLELSGRAQKGDRTALVELEARSARDRSADEWRAIGHGYCEIGQLGTCIEKYRDGVTRKPSLAKDPTVLADVRKAAEAQDVYRDALELAALHLWAPGVDIVYDVWSTTKGDSSRSDVNKRAKEFVDDGAIRAKASDALKPTLDLQRAIKKHDCTTVKKSIRTIAESGDVRAVPILQQLKATSGCGLLGLSDCWSCLRGEVNIGDTIDAVKGRSAPTFTP